MRKLYSWMLIALVSAGTALADEMVTKVITIRHANMSLVTHTIGPLLPGSNVVMSNDNDHLVLRGPKDIVAGLEAVITQLDVPPPVKRDVETTVYMVIASAQGAPTALPAELEPVVKQLKSVFTYKGFRLLDSFVLRSRDLEKGETSGFVPPLADSNVPPGFKISYNFRYNRVTLDGSDTAPVVRYDGLRLGLRVPIASGGSVVYMEAGIGTDVDVPEGKKVVVGKTSAIEGPESALILVISAKVVD